MLAKRVKFYDFVLSIRRKEKFETFAKIIFAFIIQSVYIWHRMCITVKRLLSTNKKYTVLYWVGPNSINTTFWLQVEENLMVGWFCLTGRNCAVPNQFHLPQGWCWVESVKLKNKLVWSWWQRASLLRQGASSRWKFIFVSAGRRGQHWHPFILLSVLCRLKLSIKRGK